MWLSTNSSTKKTIRNTISISATNARTNDAIPPSNPTPAVNPSTSASVVHTDISAVTASVHTVISPNQPAISTNVIGISRIVSCNDPSPENAAITAETMIEPTATASATHFITPPICCAV